VRCGGDAFAGNGTDAIRGDSKNRFHPGAIVAEGNCHHGAFGPVSD
jgi:hypothetical protein